MKYATKDAAIHINMMQFPSVVADNQTYSRDNFFTDINDSVGSANMKNSVTSGF